MDAPLFSTREGGGRRLGTIERIFLALESFFPVNFCISFTTRERIPVERVSRAALHTVSAFPVLRARPDGRVPRFVVEHVDRVPVTTIDPAADLDSVLLDELRTPFGRSPINLRVATRTVAGGTQFVFTFAHYAVDGIGAVRVVRHVLDAVAAGPGPAAASERAISPALDDLFPLAWRTPPLSRLLRFGLDVATKRKTFTLKSARTTTIGLVRRKLDAETTSNLLARCREHGCTIQGALVAAALRVSAPADTSTAGCMSPIDLRDQLDLASRDSVGVCMGVAVTWHEVQRRSFWEIASDATLQIREWKRNPELRALDARLEKTAVTLRAMLTPAVYCSAFVTNLGNVDLLKSADGPQLDDVFISLTGKVIGPGILITACTFDGALSLAFGHSEPPTDTRTAEARADTAMVLLSRAAAGTAPEPR